ncbi:MAG: type IV pilin N-terminal domain-containing protein [Halarchaeum sp.]
MPSNRAVAPALGVVLLTACCVVAACTLAAGAFALGGDALAPASASDPVTTTVAATASADGTVTLTHRSGRPLDVRTLDARVSVNGRSLDAQPPVPFVGARGFAGAPTGPFNAAANATWTVGETASFRVASTNAPALHAGDSVVVRLVRDGRVVATARTRVA